MTQRRSREAALEFLEYVAKKGLMAPATARARKAAVSKVLGILSDDEAVDVTNLDLDEVVTRFGHLHGKEYTPNSLITYKSRVSAALEDFANYVDNPLGFKPSLKTRSRKTTTKENSSGVKTPETRSNASTSAAEMATSSGPMSSSILPIPIRSDLTIKVQGLPFDLTEVEAKKIANVILAMGTSG